jgi:hypothetical protein
MTTKAFVPCEPRYLDVRVDEKNGPRPASQFLERLTAEPRCVGSIPTVRSTASPARFLERFDALEQHLLLFFILSFYCHPGRGFAAEGLRMTVWKPYPIFTHRFILGQISIVESESKRCYICYNYGEMAEWLKAHAWKACVSAVAPRVQIPLSPPSFATLRLGRPTLLID